jgi:chromosome segregation ATPase
MLQIAELRSGADQLEFEKSQLSAQIQTYEEHISILKTKNVFLRKELKQHHAAHKDLQRITDELKVKLQRKAKKLRSVSQYLEQNDFETVVASLSEENCGLRQQLQERQQRRSEPPQLAFENHFLKLKISTLEESLREANLLNSKLAASAPHTTHNNREVEALAQKLEGAQRRYSESAQIIEELRDRLARREDNRSQQIAQMELLQEEVERVRQRSHIPAGQNEVDVIRLAELSREVERLKTDLQEFNTTRIERDTLLQDVKILQDRVAALNAIESQNVELCLKIEAMATENRARNIREARQSEQIARLLRDREQLEIVRNELLRIEEELNQRGGLEKKLQCRVNFYRVQAHEQRAQLGNCETQLKSFQERIIGLEKENARLKRQVDERQATARQRVPALNRERKRIARAKAENLELRRKLAKYRAVLDDGR